MPRRPHLFTAAALLLLVWGVFAFGAVYTWAHVPLLIFAAAVALLGFVAARDAGQRGLGDQWLLAVCLAAVVAAAVVQVIPLPPHVVTSISPARDDVNFAQLHAMNTFGSYDPSAGPEPPRTLSIEPSRTSLGIALATGLSLLLIGASAGFRAVRPTMFVRGLIVIGVLAAFVELVQLGLRGETRYLAYGFFPPFNRFTPSVPFMNRNHQAGFLVMTACMSLSYLASCVMRGWERVKPNWRERILWFGSPAGSESLLVAFAFMVMATGVIATQSRSGAVILVLSLGLFGSVVLRRRWSRAIKAVILACALAAFGGAASFAGLDAVAKRLAAISVDDPAGRAAIWDAALAQVRDFPISGTGLNTFGVAATHYRGSGRPTRTIEAHNDYLQLASEGGLLLAVPVFASILALIVLIRRRFKESADDPRTYWLRVGAVIALAAIACQALVDFTLQMPGAAATFALLAALAIHRPQGARGTA